MYGNGVNRSTAKAIGKQIEKLLHDLGNPEPPLKLDHVRHLLTLDRHYYSSDDHSLFTRAFHKMTIAGKQLINRPGLIKDVISKRKLRALWDPDARQIFVDAELPDPKKRWAEAHEIGHSLCDWHETFLHGDQKQTLSIACHIQIEAEANFAAGQLLFLGSDFVDRWSSTVQDLGAVQSLQRIYQNSLTTTMWKAIECTEVPAFGLICQHPRYVDQTLPLVDHVIHSELFSRQFTCAGSDALFAAVKSIADYRRRGPVGEGDVCLIDDNGDKRPFVVQLFNNSYQTLAFGRGLAVNSSKQIYMGTF
jgi:hypothetical protein